MRRGRPRPLPRSRRFAHVRHARNSTGHRLCGRPARTLSPATPRSSTGWPHVVLRYLKHTRTLGIGFSDGHTELDGFSDADFATSDPSRRRVTSGYCFRLLGGPISWQSKRQPSVSLSTWLTAIPFQPSLPLANFEVAAAPQLRTLQVNERPTAPSSVRQTSSATPEVLPRRGNHCAWPGTRVPRA
jgi:hypothetical protein